MPEDFFAIQQSLREKLAVLQEENELINRTQESKKPLKEKDIDSVNRLIPPFSSEEIMLMLQAKSDKRRAKGRPSYCPFLIDDANKNKFINFLAGISKDKPFHYDIILTNGNHCTPLQIHSDGIDIRMFSLDAAGDNRNQQAIEEIEDALGIISYNNSEVGTQKDSISCSIYSIQDLNSMSKLSQEELTTSLSQQPLEADAQLRILHPKFIKNSQTTSLLERYKNLRTDQALLRHNKTLDQYLENYSITIEVSNEATRELEYKNKNHAIIAKKYKYTQAALETLKAAHEKGEDIESIFKNRSGENIFNEAKSQLTDEQKILVKDVYNAKQINLVLTYGVGRESLPCFNNGKMTDRAISFITDGIDPSNITDNDRQSMQARIDKIKDLKTFAQLTAVLDYNLDPTEVPKSNCLRLWKTRLFYIKQNRERDEEVIKRIGLVHGVEGGNSLAATELFDKIKHCSTKEDIILLLDYGIPNQWEWGMEKEILRRVRSLNDNVAENQEEETRIMINKIKDLDNEAKISAVLDYGLEPKEIKETREFGNEKLKYIKTWWDSGKTIEEKTRFAQEAFSKVKNISEFQASLINSGVSINIVKSVHISRDTEEPIKKFITRYYKLAGENGANTAYKSLLSLGENTYIGNEQFNELKKTPKELQQYFAERNPELSLEWGFISEIQAQNDISDKAQTKATQLKSALKAPPIATESKEKTSVDENKISGRSGDIKPAPQTIGI